MKDKKIFRLFYALASLARDAGMEFSLSLEDEASASKTLNGALTDSCSKSKGLVLRCSWPEPAAAEDGGADDDGKD